MKIRFKHLYFLLLSFSFFQLSGQTYQFAESSEYDPLNGQWLSSNSFDIIADDGNGNLSYFGTGSPTHGMEVLDSLLFAIDADVLRVFSLETEAEVASIMISGSLFPNGITSDGVSNIYITDFAARRIYKVNVSDIQNMSFEIIADDMINVPNGIVYDEANNRLIFVTWGTNAPIQAIDLSNYEISTIITTNLGNIDGIDDDNAGNYYISSWDPDQITKYDPDFANPPEIITTPAINNPADIGYSKETDSLAIPIGDDVVFVGFEPDTSVNVVTISEQVLDFGISPNPVTDQSNVQFELTEDQDLNLEIFDNQGRLIKSLLTGKQPAGKHKILLAGLNLTSGIYHLRLQNKSVTVTRKMVVH